MKVKDTKAYQLFASLTLQERKDFARFLRRHSKPKRIKLKAGLQFLRANAVAIAQGSLSNEDWWAYVFPEEPFGVQAMRKHQNALVSDLETFLVERKLFKDSDPYLARVREGEQYMLLLASLLERSRDNLFLSYAKKAEALVAGLPHDHDRYDLKLQLEFLKLNFQQKTTPFRSREGFTRSQTALDRHYVLQSLKLEVATRNQKQLTRMQSGRGHLGIIYTLMATWPAEEHDPLARLCLDLLHLSEISTYKQWTSLYDRLLDASAALSPESWKDLLYVLLNFSIRRINEGQNDFRAAALDVYLTLLESGLLQRDISAFKTNFLNIIQLAINQDEHEKLARYIYAQKTTLAQDEDYQTALLFYDCEAAFSRGEYPQACSCFRKVWLLEDGQKVRHAAGIFILKSLYECGFHDEVKAFAAQFKKSISQSALIPDSKKLAYKEFLKTIHILCDVRFNGLTPKHRARLAQLEENVNAKSLRMISRKWLATKIEALWQAPQ